MCTWNALQIDVRVLTRQYITGRCCHYRLAVAAPARTATRSSARAPFPVVVLPGMLVFAVAARRLIGALAIRSTAARGCPCRAACRAVTVTIPVSMMIAFVAAISRMMLRTSSAAVARRAASSRPAAPPPVSIPLPTFVSTSAPIAVVVAVPLALSIRISVSFRTPLLFIFVFLAAAAACLVFLATATTSLLAEAAASLFFLGAVGVFLFLLAAAALPLDSPSYRVALLKLGVYGVLFDLRFSSCLAQVVPRSYLSL